MWLDELYDPPHRPSQLQQISVIISPFLVQEQPPHVHQLLELAAEVVLNFRRGQCHKAKLA